MRLKKFLTWLSLTFCLYFVASMANAYLTPLYVTISGQGQFSNGTVSAPSISFTNQTDAGFYRIGSNDIGMAVAGILGLEAKKATGSFVNFGFGGAASVSNSFIALYERTLVGAPLEIEISNPNNAAGAAAGFEAVINGSADSFTFFTRSTASVAPYAYAGGGGVLRTSGGNLPGIRYIADDIATGNHLFFAGGNAQANLTAIIDRYGLTLTPNAAAQPSCAVGIRGQLYNKIGGAGVADELDMCMKGSADTYSWVTVKAAP